MQGERAGDLGEQPDVVGRGHAQHLELAGLLVLHRHGARAADVGQQPGEALLPVDVAGGQGAPAQVEGDDADELVDEVLLPR